MPIFGANLSPDVLVCAEVLEKDYPNGTIHSRVLHVECLPELAAQLVAHELNRLHPAGPSPHEVSMLRFDVVLKDIVVMPGQAFELAFTGGPTKNERTYFDYVSSAPDVVSVDLGIC